MIIVNRVGDQISGSVNGVPFSVSYTESKYKSLLEIADKAKRVKDIVALRILVAEANVLIRDNYADFVETKSPYIKVNKETNKFYLQYNGAISTRAMPEDFAKRIIHAVERATDILPLVKFWVRFLHCPVYTDPKAILLVKYISSTYTNDTQVRLLMSEKGLSEVAAIDWSTTHQVAITQEGLMVGYKASAEITNYKQTLARELAGPQKMLVDVQTGLMKYDPTPYDEDRIFEPAVQHQSGDAFYCGNYLGHIIKVGKVHKLSSWDMVNCNDNQSCVPGLHVGGLRYIQGYQSAGTVTHNIFIDPMHIGAVCDIDHGDGAMRVKQYFVYSAFSGVNKQLYYSSNYAQASDKEFQRMLGDAVSEKYIEKPKKELPAPDEDSYQKFTKFFEEDSVDDGEDIAEEDED